VKIGTSTNLVSFNADGSKTEMIHLLALYAKEGMQTLDLNFCEMLNPHSSLRDDDYLEYVYQLAHLRKKYNLTFHQAHAPYVNDRTQLSTPETELFDRLFSRTIEIAGILSIPVLVVHPIKRSLYANLKYFQPFIEQSKMNHVILAFENLNANDEMTEVTDLIQLVDSFGTNSAGICYDTGHAHMRGHDLAKDISSCGNRLIATHIADNHGKQDEHLLPYYGTVDWDEVIHALVRIEYQGHLTFECMFFNRHLPQDLKTQAIHQAKIVGDYLLSRIP